MRLQLTEDIGEVQVCPYVEGCLHLDKFKDKDIRELEEHYQSFCRTVRREYCPRFIELGEGGSK